VSVVLEGDEPRVRLSEVPVALTPLSADVYIASGCGPQARIGFMDEPSGLTEFVFVNGHPCRRTPSPEEVGVDLHELRAHTGSYVGAVDALDVRIEGGGLVVHSAEHRMTVPCIPLPSGAFSTCLGVIEFETEPTGAHALTIGGSVRLRRASF
jgi:hypothetical protein